eukprot:scaffold84547_cov98-Phaeocystis_antarctica.AAC.2
MAECTACGVRKGGKSRVQETESEQLVRSSGFSVAPMGVSSTDTNADGPMDQTAPARNRNHGEERARRVSESATPPRNHNTPHYEGWLVR